MINIGTLIAVYAGDHAEHFRSALRSVVSQRIGDEYKSRIYLGIDGPVSDDLEIVVREYLPFIHKVARSPTNRGLAETLNSLLSQLDDEQFIFRMDADDISMPGRYASQLKFLASNLEVDILGTAITEFGSGLAEQEVRFAKDDSDARANAHKRVPVAHPTVCVRRRVFDTVQRYPTVGTNEDVALWFECMKAGFTFGNLPVSFLRFRVSTNFWQRRSARKAWCEFNML